METTNVRAFSITEALRFGWDSLKANLNPLAIFGAAGAFLALLSSALQRSGGVGGVLAIVVQVLELVLMLAIMRVALMARDGRALELEPKRLVAGFPGFFITSFLYGLIVAVGMALLIVPGVIWGTQFALAMWLSAEHGREPLEALKESSRLTRGVRWRLFELAVVLLGLNLLGLAALGVGVIFTMPISVVAVAHVYRRLLERGPQEEAPAPPVFPTARPA